MDVRESTLKISGLTLYLPQSTSPELLPYFCGIAVTLCFIYTLSYYFCGLSSSLVSYYIVLILGLFVNYELEGDWKELVVV